MSALLKFEVNGVKAGSFKTPSNLVLELECDSQQMIVATINDTIENLIKLGYQLGRQPVEISAGINRALGVTNLTTKYKKIGDFCGNSPQFPVSMQVYIKIVGAGHVKDLKTR